MKIVKCKICGHEHKCTRMSPKEAAALSWERRRAKIREVVAEAQKAQEWVGKAVAERLGESEQKKAAEPARPFQGPRDEEKR